MSHPVRQMQMQCLVLAVMALVAIAPPSAIAQIKSRLRSNNGSTDSNARAISYVPKPDEQLLRGKNIGTSTEQLWQFLADPMLPPWEAPLEEWLKPFHKASKAHHLERFRALERLETRGLDGDKWPYLGTNLKCCYADQPEFVRDVKQVLLKEHERSAPRVVEAAIRLLTHRKPDGFSKQFIGLAPALVQLDHRVEQVLIDALAEAAMPTGKPDPSLLTATKANSSIVRALAIRSLLRSGGLEADAAAALKDDDLTVKWQIAMGLIDVKNKTAIPALIDLIPDVSGKRASRLAKLLHHIAGNGPNPALGGDTESRARAHQAWSAWWKEHGESVTSDQVSHGITFAYNDTHVAEVSLSGEILWELEIRPTLRSYPTCAQRLANGNILIGESSTSTFETGFVPNGRLLELTRTGAVIWERRVGRARTFERLSDGRTLIGGNILDVKGNRRQLLPPGSCYHVRSNPEGGFVFTRHGETTVQGYPSAVNDGPCYRKLTEVDDDGTVTRVTRVRDEVTFGSSNWYFEFMENGHLLVCRANDVMELDKDRKPVKIFAKGEFIERVQRLENGNFLISIHGCGKSKVEEYTRDGKKVRTMQLPSNLHFVRRR